MLKLTLLNMLAVRKAVLLCSMLVPAMAAVDNPLETHPNKDLLPASICGTQLTTRVFGNQVSPGQFPWVALIQYLRGNDTHFLCGGVLINKRYVLTAAHCLDSRSARENSPNMVRLGEHNLAMDPDVDPELQTPVDPVLDFGIEQRIVHENFNLRSKQNDIALIRLDSDVPVTSYVRPICLPSPEEDSELTSAPNKLLEVGWGITAGGRLSEVPRKLSVPVLDSQACADLYSTFQRNVTDQQVCAGGEGYDSCVGSAGSALMGHNGSLERYFAVGIVSYGPHCASRSIPTVYTRVASYLDWILDHMSP